MVFHWKGINDISGVTYALQISKNENFASVILEQDGLKQNEFTVPEGELEAVTKENPYYWRVKAVDGASNESDWSETRSFSTGLMFTLPNGEPELTLSAWVTYLAGVGIILLIVLSFLIGRKTNSY